MNDIDDEINLLNMFTEISSDNTETNDDFINNLQITKYLGDDWFIG